MGLFNCTINSSQVTVAKGSQIGSGVANQVLTITPDEGYVLRAADFTKQSPPTGIASIVLADSGTPYAANNTITVTCDLTDSGSYSVDTTFVIDIDGSAILDQDQPKTLAGAVTTTATNASGAASNVAYTGTDTTGTTKDLFTKTVTANTNYYFSTEPTISVTTGDISNYVITSTTSNDGSGNLNSKTFNVDGIIPLEDDLNDVIAISAVAVAVPTGTNNINSYSFDTSTGRYTLEKRTLKVYGDVGAKYKLTVTRTGDSHTYNFTTKDFTSSSTDSGEQTISSGGFNEIEFTFPTVTADVTYTFTLAAVSPTSLALTQTHPFTVARAGNKSITVNATSTERGTFQSKTIAYTNYAGTAITQSAGSNSTYGFAGSENEDNNSAEFNFSIVLDDNHQFIFKAPNASANTITLSSSDFSITPGDATAATIAQGTLTATRSADSGSNANQLLTLTGTDWYGWKIGTADTIINVNVDSFIQANTLPVAANATFNGTEDNALVIDLSAHASDANSDALTYSIVADNSGANGTLGSVNASTGAITYTPASNNNTNVTFTWKVNDGYGDSNTATATLNIAAVADDPTDIALSANTLAENSGVNAVIGTLTATDPDQAYVGGNYVYSLVSGTGSTDNAKFNLAMSDANTHVLRMTNDCNFESPADGDSNNTYLCRIRVTRSSDNKYFEKAFTVTVTNVNEAPTDIALSAATQAENTAINTIIGALSTTDADAGDTHTYTLVSGTGSTDNASFNISGANLRNSAVFDYEVKNSYSIRVRSTDAAGLYFEKQFTITVTDVTESTTWKIEVYNSDGSASGVIYYASPTHYCNGTNVAVMPGGCFAVNDFVRIVLKIAGCTGTDFGGGKILDTNVSGQLESVYIKNAVTYSSAADSINSTNGSSC